MKRASVALLGVVSSLTVVFYHAHVVLHLSGVVGAPLLEFEREVRARARAFWGEYETGDDPAQAARALAEVDRRLVLHTSPFALRTFDLGAVPVRDLVVAEAPAMHAVHRGLPAHPVREALAIVHDRLGVDLAAARVRVGVTRGHLLSVVVSVPLDVPGDGEEVEEAATALVEWTLGDDFLDLWVVSVDVTRSARSRGLLVVRDGGSEALNYPIFELAELAHAGALGIVNGIAESAIRDVPDAWTAFDLEPTGETDPTERTFASTTDPEALKATLSGLPFDSRRFSRSGELFVWLSYPTAPGGGRVARQVAVERAIGALDADDVRLAGKGFGAVVEYVDLWIRPEPDVLARVGEAVAAVVGGAVTLGFHDTRFALHRVAFG